MIIYIVGLQLVCKVMELYTQGIQQEFAEVDPSTNFDEYFAFMKWVCIVLSCLVTMRQSRDFWLRTKKRYMGY